MESSRIGGKDGVVSLNKTDSGKVSSLTIISRVVLLVCLFLLAYLGYRFWVIREIDRTYSCVEHTVERVDSLNALVDGSEGLLIDEASQVLETAEQVEEDLSEDDTCISRSVKEGGLYEACASVETAALAYVGKVKEAASLASEDTDTYGLQDEITAAYTEYRDASSSCEDRIEEVLRSMTLEL
jgi:hypothetical protein